MIIPAEQANKANNDIADVRRVSIMILSATHAYSSF